MAKGKTDLRSRLPERAQESLDCYVDGLHGACADARAQGYAAPPAGELRPLFEAIDDFPELDAEPMVQFMTGWITAAGEILGVLPEVVVAAAKDSSGDCPLKADAELAKGFAERIGGPPCK